MAINPAYLIPVSEVMNARKKKLPAIPEKEEILKLLTYV